MRQRTKEALEARNAGVKEVVQVAVEEGAWPRELALALERVGTSDRERLTWLLGFERKDVGQLSQGQLLDMVWEIVAFWVEVDLKRLPGGQTRLGPFPGFTDLHEQVMRDHEAAGAEVKSIHVRLCDCLRRLFTNGSAEYQVSCPPLLRLLRLPTGQISRGVFNQSLSDTFIPKVFDLLMRLGDHLTRCANQKCNNLLVRHRRQVFCSPRCSQSARTKKWRETHRERLQQMRRNTYAKKMRRKHGEKVRIQRRGTARRSVAERKV